LPEQFHFSNRHMLVLTAMNSPLPTGKRLYPPRACGAHKHGQEFAGAASNVEHLSQPIIDGTIVCAAQLFQLA
jgi:hypothetical protein